MLKEIGLWLAVTFNPSFWLVSSGVDKVWDAKLRKMLEDPKFETNYYGWPDRKGLEELGIPVETNPYTIILNGTVLWMSIYPFAYGQDWSGKLSDVADSINPTRRTKLLLRRAMNKWEKENAGVA